MSKKIYAVMNCDESPVEYLTAGKEYPTGKEELGPAFTIEGDNGNKRLCLWNDCAHLSGGNWRRIERDEPETEEGE